MSGKRELDVIMRDTLVQNDGERMKEDMAYIMAVSYTHLVTTRTVWLSPVSRIPMGFFFSVMAFLGHTRLQPPQLWQTSEKTIGLSLTYIRAWNRQNWTHSRQPVHAPASNSGSREQTVSVSTWSGRKSRLHRL